MGDKRPTGTWPPQWEKAAGRDGFDPATYARTPAGHTFLLVWRAYPDATDLEQRWARTPSPDMPSLPLGTDAVRRVAALRAARRQFRDLSDGAWRELVMGLMGTLPASARVDPDALSAALRSRVELAGELAGASRGSPSGEPEARGLALSLVRAAVAEARRARDRQPTMEDVASRLGVSCSTLRRAMRDLGFERWPPAPLSDALKSRLPR